MKRSRACALVVALVAIGCRSQPSTLEPPLPAGSSCAGSLLLTISNNTRSELEVVEMRGTTSTVVAIVPPGQQTITVTPGASYGAREVGSTTFIAWERATKGSPLVRFRRECVTR